LTVRIRLRRSGTTNNPHYRLVVADSRERRDGRFLEIIGHYHPQTNPPEIKIDEQKALKWLKDGAQPSDTAKMLLSKSGVLVKFIQGKEERRRERTKDKAEKKKVKKPL